MTIEYANYHNWYKQISDDPLLDFGKSTQKRLRTTLDKAEEMGVRYEIRKIDDAFLAWFIPLYEESIGQKENPHIYDIRNIIAEKSKTTDYYCLTVYEQDVPLGGTIFSDRGNRFSYGYRSFQNTWNHARLPSTPTFYAEYVLAQYSLAHGKHKLSHGKDRNPYGINSGIGLCTFKLSVGCIPKLPKVYETHSIDITQINENMLVLEKPETGMVITDAHLCVREADLEKFIQVTKYPERLRIHVHTR